MRSEDLTAQARIRNAAVELFARDGFEKTNLRAIAAAAGVSAGLVIHHFGSKDELIGAGALHVCATPQAIPGCISQA